MPAFKVSNVKSKYQGIGCRLNLLVVPLPTTIVQAACNIGSFGRTVSRTPSPLTSNASTCGKAGFVLSAMDTAVKEQIGVFSVWHPWHAADWLPLDVYRCCI